MRASVKRTARLLAVLAIASPAYSQSSRPTGQVSVYTNTAGRDWTDGTSRRDTELATSVTVESPRSAENGAEYRLDMRHTRYASGGQPDRLSIYDGFAGARFGGELQVRVRGGQMWLQDLGTIGALAGGLLEIGKSSGGDGLFRAGFFSGVEPKLYETGYVAGVHKYGGYAAYESGYLRRHVVGFTTIKHGDLRERSVLSVTNYIPAGQSFFAYQAAEYEVQGPAQGAASGGLSYFLANARFSASSRVELNGTYNRGRSLDARQLTDDVINGRPLTAQAIEGLRYESAGGRITVEALPRLRIYAGYTRDRNNRDDAAFGRILVGGHAANVFGTGLDISASDSRVQRASGPYHSSYFSVGRSLGRTVYVSADYTTSLSVVRFLRSDGVVIETRPSTRRYTGSGSVTLNRHFSILTTIDYTLDDAMREVRILSGLSYRIR